ncbi:hypothetical protein YN1_5450 [Nanoarchaeota archaeon]
MRSDAFTILIILLGIILGIVVYLVLFVPPSEIAKYLGGGSNKNLPVSFKVSLMYYTSNSIGAFIYNQGPGTVYLNNMNVYAEYYPYGGSYNCNITASNYTLSPDSQVSVIINCENENQIISNLFSNNGYYIFYFNYKNYEQTYNLTTITAPK